MRVRAVAQSCSLIHSLVVLPWQSEEAFFTDNVLFHTITIDEGALVVKRWCQTIDIKKKYVQIVSIFARLGHRLKNSNSSLAKSLSRLTVPFRLLLTGTPMQVRVLCIIYSRWMH